MFRRTLLLFLIAAVLPIAFAAGLAQLDPGIDVAGPSFNRTFLPAILLAVFLVGAFSVYQVRRSIGPLKFLRAAARQIAVGDFHSRVQIRTGDEFESLGSEFNAMAESVSRQITALEAMSAIDQMILSGRELGRVSEAMLGRLVELSGCRAAAVVARDADTGSETTMVSWHAGEFHTDDLVLPEATGWEWREIRQIDLCAGAGPSMPFADRFGRFGLRYVVVVPTLLRDEFKGIFVLGFKRREDIDDAALLPCSNLSRRFAMALDSVEREKALYRQANYDSLTGLPNRQLLKDRLAEYLADARAKGQSGALMFLDLDRFKEINDVFGHSVGDAVLTQASDRILSQVREGDMVARLGGDEFVVVLPSIANEHLIKITAERLMAALCEAFTVKNVDHFLSVSIGIAVFPDDGTTVETLLKNADAAMYRAKDSGRNRFDFFSHQLNAESRRKISIERDLRVAFQSGDLEIHYQPQFDIYSNEVSGAETLLRWHHPKKGAISPGEFVPLAEDSELIVEIGEWVIQRACEDLRVLLQRDLHPGAISINASARQLADSSFRDAVLLPMHRSGINPAYMQLEVTETTVAQNKDIAVAVLQSLRDAGVRVALDDFGTGYSSLSYLEQMPFDAIKIDKSFVDRIGSSTTSDNICRTIIRMAEQLGKKSIAEGVETMAQLDFLKVAKCDCVQGYYFSRPLPFDQFLKFVQKQDFHTQRRKALEIVG